MYLLAYGPGLVVFAMLATLMMVLKYDRRIDDMRLLEKDLGLGAP
jgi:hypothetical protein